MRFQFSKNSRMASGCRPHQKVAMIGTGLGWINGVQWANADGMMSKVSQFPNQRQPVTTIPPPHERSEPKLLGR